MCCGSDCLPTISEFFGIVVRMYYDDHPPPHFHAIYNEYEALIRIDTLEIFRGTLPKRARSLLIEWAVEHRNELENNWDRLEKHEPLEKIQPLE